MFAAHLQTMDARAEKRGRPIQSEIFVFLEDITMKPMPAATALSLLALTAIPAHAQWDPNNGDWGKEVSTDLRVMTWNVQDGLCRSNDKLDTLGDWNALVRIVAALEPDILILQECADNSGNGTGSGADSTSQLETVAELFIHGGADPFNGGNVGSYIQLFKPGYDLPFMFASTNTDAFNRNMILSRYPIADINGDGSAEISDFIVLPDAYQSGGDGGIRGFQFAEINLPDEVYAGDVVVGNAHLKAGGGGSDFDQREKAAENTAYYIDYYYNGAGTGTSDPNGKVIIPSGGSILDPNTPVIWGGDLNEQPNSGGPSEFMTRAQNFGGTDGTDRDRSDSTISSASQPISGETGTQGSSSRLDYLLWQDSIATARRQFIFRSSGSGMGVAQLPFPVSTYPIVPTGASNAASDHRPIIIDFIMPLAVADPCPAPPDYIDDNMLNLQDVFGYLNLYNFGDPEADLVEPFGTLNLQDVFAYLALFNAGCP